MSIVSFYFFVFIAVLLLLYYCVPVKWRWVVLFCASITFFYFNCGWKLYLVFASQLILAWGGALYISHINFLQSRKFNKKEKLRDNSKLKSMSAFIIIALESVALILMKESSFFIINARIVTGINIPFLDWVVPLGVSYYTLMLISYIANVLWGKAEAEKNPLKLALGTGFFLQMVSGPFTRYEEISNEFFRGNRFDIEQLKLGSQRFLWGLFKKLVLAERFGAIVSTIYDGGLESTWTPTGSYIFIGAFCYMFQLYTDFSGCMDIVIGAAQMFGIKLPDNFHTPLYSTSLSEFWRRWHMTLGLWLKDYVMYPTQKALTSRFGQKAKKLFGKKRGKDIILYISMFVTWFSIGFWHGGSYKYICASGLFFFVMIVGGLILKPAFLQLQKLLRINPEAWSWTLFQRLRTVFLFTFSVSFGRAASLSEGFLMWRNVFVYNPWVFVDGSLYKLGLDSQNFWIMVFGTLILMAVSKVQQRGSVREIIAKQNLLYRWFLWIALFVAVLLFGMYGEGYNPTDFIYGGF